MNHRAAALIQLGRTDEAQQTLERALGKDPEHAMTHTSLGWHFVAKREMDRAIEHFKQALRLDPRQDVARTGIVEAFRGRYRSYRLVQRLVEWLNSAWDQAPTVVNVVYFVCLCMAAGAASNWLGSTVLQKNTRNPPPKEMWLVMGALGLCFVLLVFFSWIYRSVYDALLRFHSLGWLSLSKEERRLANLIGACVLGAALFIGLGTTVSSKEVVATGCVVLGFAMPIAVTGACGSNRLRQFMIAYDVGLLLWGAASVTVLLMSSFVIGDDNRKLRDAAVSMLVFYFAATVGSAMIVNAYQKEEFSHGTEL